MTTLAGTAYRGTVGVAGEPTVGRATALVAVVMCLAAVSEPCYGASNGGRWMPGCPRPGPPAMRCMALIRDYAPAWNSAA